MTVVGGSGWLINEIGNFSFVTGDSIMNGGIGVIIGGIILIVCCSLGIIGAIFKLKLLLVIVSQCMFNLRYSYLLRDGASPTADQIVVLYSDAAKYYKLHATVRVI